MMLASTGTGAMDASVSNLFNKGDKVITINCGKFGERWTKIAKAYELVPVELKYVPGEASTAADVEKTLKTNPDAKAVFFRRLKLQPAS